MIGIEFFGLEGNRHSDQVEPIAGVGALEMPKWEGGDVVGLRSWSPGDMKLFFDLSFARGRRLIFRQGFFFTVTSQERRKIGGWGLLGPAANRAPFEPGKVERRGRICDVQGGNDMPVGGNFAGHDVGESWRCGSKKWLSSGSM